MAVKDGDAYIWGDVLGTNVLTPQKVNGLKEIVDVAICYTDPVYDPNPGVALTGFFALDKDGFLWAWGRNDYGQLGIEMGFGTSQWITTPQRVGEAEGLTFTSISAGFGFVLAIGEPVPVPEPVSLLVLGVGAAGLLSRRRR